MPEYDDDTLDEDELNALIGMDAIIEQAEDKDDVLFDLTQGEYELKYDDDWVQSDIGD